MATTTRIRTGYDTWVGSGAPTAKHPVDNRLRLAGTTQYGYLYFPLGPELRNATILSATLHIWGVGTGWGTRTITVQRLAAPFDASTLSWNNKPGVTGTAATLTQTNPDDPTEWLIPVTSLLQDFASGARWYGVRLSIDSGATVRAFRSLNAIGRTPWLEVVWTDAPAAPVDLSPGGGRAVSVSRPVLAWSNENNPDGETLTAFEIQVDPAANGASPAFASGTVVSDLAEYDLAQSAYAGLASSASTQWHVRVRDEAGVWSPWSDWATFTRVAKGTVTITTPGATVAEYTPPVAWTTSFTQTAWSVRVLDDDGNILHDTGRKVGTDQDYTIPAKDSTSGRRILVDDRDYRLQVRAWDNVEREATPGDPSSAFASVVFNYNDDPTPNQVTALTATQDGFTPYVDLVWQRSTTPDYWSIVDNGRVVVSGIAGPDLLVTGTTYAYRYKDALPGDHDLKVKPTVNGLTAGSPTVSVTVAPAGVWVLGEGPDGEDIDVFIPTKELGDFSMPDRATTFTLPGQRTPVRITQGVGGWQGTISGRLVDAADQTVDTWRDRMLRLKRRGQPVRIFFGKEAIEAVIFNINVDPSRDSQTRNVSFEFFQVGTIDWLD